ncbi:MAG: hypothetical protein ABSG20_14405 [Bradyrhizobium sp.]|jgi:hypothetical protein
MANLIFPDARLRTSSPRGLDRECLTKFGGERARDVLRDAIPLVQHLLLSIHKSRSTIARRHCARAMLPQISAAGSVLAGVGTIRELIVGRAG